MRTSNRFVLGILTLAALSVCSHRTEAATIVYGDFASPTGDVTFDDVTEFSGPDEPDTFFATEDNPPEVAGNTLRLPVPNFRVEAGAGAGVVDTLDSRLETMIVADPLSTITSVTIDESGGYLLGGLSGGEGSVRVSTAIFVIGGVIDGVEQFFPGGGIPVPFTVRDGTGAVVPNGLFNRPTFDNPNPPTWFGNALFDVTSGLASIGLSGDVTKLTLTFDNQMTAIADEVSFAEIDKKNVTISVDTNIIPEPNALGLAFILGATAVAGRRSTRI